MGRFTYHAKERIRERMIPDALVREVIEKGRKTFLPDRNAVEHRIRNVLGLRGVSLVVVISGDGAILTSYVEKVRRVRDGGEARRPLD